jgi:hypothetical protein
MVSIQKNGGRRQVRIDRHEFQGREGVDAREYYQTLSGEWLPTKNGLFLAPAEARQVGEAMAATAAEMEAQG